MSYVPLAPFLVYNTVTEGDLAASYVAGPDFQLRSPYLGVCADYDKGSETSITIAIQIKLPDGTYADWLSMERTADIMEWTFTGTQNSAKCLCGDRDNQPSQFCFGKTIRLKVKAAGIVTSPGVLTLFAGTFKTSGERYD